MLSTLYPSVQSIMSAQNYRNAATPCSIDFVSLISINGHNIIAMSMAYTPSLLESPYPTRHHLSLCQLCKGGSPFNM